MILLIAMLVFAAAGAGYGWVRRDELVKRARYNQPYRPDGVSRSDHARTLSHWRRRRQIYGMLLYAVFGALVALVLALFIQAAGGMLPG